MHLPLFDSAATDLGVKVCVNKAQLGPASLWTVEYPQAVYIKGTAANSLSAHVLERYGNI